MEKQFSVEPIATSSRTGEGLERLRTAINKYIVNLRAGCEESSERIAITNRHRHLVEETLQNLEDAIGQIHLGNDEISSMLLRISYERLSGIERENVDEAVLERIFSSFCVGK